MKCVKIENGIVINSAIFDKAPTGWVKSDAGIGDLYDEATKSFTRPKKEVVKSDAEIRSESMRKGADYNGYQISFTADDGNGVLQVKAAFDLGLTKTNIHFANGTVMPITATEFSEFALWFVEQRNSFF